VKGYGVIQPQDRGAALDLVRDHPFLALGDEYAIETRDVEDLARTAEFYDATRDPDGYKLVFFQKKQAIRPDRSAGRYRRARPYWRS
jgi:hypothetical protein